jgi:hypothetical protein
LRVSDAAAPAAIAARPVLAGCVLVRWGAVNIFDSAPLFPGRYPDSRVLVHRRPVGVQPGFQRRPFARRQQRHRATADQRRQQRAAGDVEGRFLVGPGLLGGVQQGFLRDVCMKPALPI